MDLVAIYNAAAIVSVFGISGWMLRMWLNHQERMRQISMSQQELASSTARLARVEQAVEAVAIEVERISEGQRYVTKLLSERTPPQAPTVPPAAGKRVDTPH